MSQNELVNRRALWLHAPQDAEEVSSESSGEGSSSPRLSNGLSVKQLEYGIGASELLYTASNAMLDVVKARTPSLTFLDIGGIGIGPSCAERLADLLNVRALSACLPFLVHDFLILNRYINYAGFVSADAS